MKEPTIVIRLTGPRRTYWPGEELAGSCHWELDPGEQVRRVEISVLWYTEGKGEEDFAVHHFQPVSAQAGQSLEGPVEFRTRLPQAPLTYEGVILKLYWCVRVRLFLRRGGQVVQERPFRLGNVPRGRPAQEPPLLPEENQDQDEKPR